MTNRYTLMKANTINSNGRMYPEDALVRAKEVIDSGKLFVTMDYSRDGAISLNNVVALPTDCVLEDGTLSISLNILETPKGKVIREFINSDVEFSVASAGLGTLGDDNTVRDYEMTSAFITNKNSWDD